MERRVLRDFHAVVFAGVHFLIRDFRLRLPDLEASAQVEHGEVVHQAVVVAVLPGHGLCVPGHLQVLLDCFRVFRVVHQCVGRHGVRAGFATLPGEVSVPATALVPHVILGPVPDRAVVALEVMFPQLVQFFLNFFVGLTQNCLERTFVLARVVSAGVVLGLVAVGAVIGSVFVVIM